MNTIHTPYHLFGCCQEAGNFAGWIVMARVVACSLENKYVSRQKTAQEERKKLLDNYKKVKILAVLCNRTHKYC